VTDPAPNLRSPIYDPICCNRRTASASIPITGCATTNAAIPEVLAYLQAENAYFEAAVAPRKPLENTLYDEIVARLKQDDASCRIERTDTGTTRASRSARSIRSSHAARISAVAANRRRRSCSTPTN
jgi:hypothetical protein